MRLGIGKVGEGKGFSFDFMEQLFYNRQRKDYKSCIYFIFSFSGWVLDVFFFLIFEEVQFLNGFYRYYCDWSWFLDKFRFVQSGQIYRV